MIGHRRIAILGLILGLACAGILLSAPGIARADDVDPDKLVGTWLLKMVDGKRAPIELEFTFGKKGQAVMPPDLKATYKIDGNKLTIRVTARVAGAKGKKPATNTITNTWFIKKLTDDVLVIGSKSSGGSESELRKKTK